MTFFQHMYAVEVAFKKNVQAMYISPVTSPAVNLPLSRRLTRDDPPASALNNWCVWKRPSFSLFVFLFLFFFRWNKMTAQERSGRNVVLFSEEMWERFEGVKKCSDGFWN